MKFIFTLLLFLLCNAPFPSQAQEYEIERLVLDIEKLAQLKDLLSDLYKGYEILNTGYTAIKNISEGNFNLHKAFLDGLLAVSPAVQKYERIADIITDQASIVSEYKSAFNRFKQDKSFSPDELIYLASVYSNLASAGEKNLDDLLNIITAGKLRMSDAERLHAIDALYASTRDQLMFLRQFNSSTSILAVQRSMDKNDAGTLQMLYGIK